MKHIDDPGAAAGDVVMDEQQMKTVNRGGNANALPKVLQPKDLLQSNFYGDLAARTTVAMGAFARCCCMTRVSAI